MGGSRAKLRGWSSDRSRIGLEIVLGWPRWLITSVVQPFLGLWKGKKIKQASKQASKSALVCLSTYLHHHIQDIDSPSDALQPHKACPNSPRGRISVQRKTKILISRARDQGGTAGAARVRPGTKGVGHVRSGTAGAVRTRDQEQRADATRDHRSSTRARPAIAGAAHASVAREHRSSVRAARA